jgi:hypothetical protein
MKSHLSGLNPNPLFNDEQGPVLEPVNDEFQPPFETVYPGGGAYLFKLSRLRPFGPFSPAAGLKDAIAFYLFSC